LFSNIVAELLPLPSPFWCTYVAHFSCCYYGRRRLMTARNASDFAAGCRGRTSLWLQWSWVQTPSLTLPSQENPNRSKCLSVRPIGGYWTPLGQFGVIVAKLQLQSSDRAHSTTRSRVEGDCGFLENVALDRICPQGVLNPLQIKGIQKVPK